MNIRSIRGLRFVFLAFVFALLGFPAAFAEPVTGVVTNKTTDKPSAGDDVVLLKLEQGMQELSRTRTDNKGHFSIDVPASGLHMIRVTHDGANYFRPVPPGTQSVELDVFTAAAKVAGVAQEADVMRIESDPSGSGLRVVEHYFIKNDSNPPKTQMSDNPFELWLQPGATVEGSAAMAPGGMAVQSALVPLSEPNHFSIIFPLRPGETQFQVTYKLPYSGSLTFTPHIAVPTDTVAIMMPKSIAFKPAAGTNYLPVTEETAAQTYVARSVQPGQPLSFTISGTGALPRDTAAQSQTQGQQPGAATVPTGPETPAEASAAMRNDTSAGKGLGNPLDSQGDLEPWAKYKWWIIGGLALVLAVGAGLLMKGPSATLEEASSAAPDNLGISGPTIILTALKEELFVLETDRLQGRLSETEYLETKAAIEVVLRRALLRAPAAIEKAPPAEAVTPV